MFCIFLLYVSLTDRIIHSAGFIYRNECILQKEFRVPLQKCQSNSTWSQQYVWIFQTPCDRSSAVWLCVFLFVYFKRCCFGLFSLYIILYFVIKRKAFHWLQQSLVYGKMWTVLASDNMRNTYARNVNSSHH